MLHYSTHLLNLPAFCKNYRNPSYLKPLPEEDNHI